MTTKPCIKCGEEYEITEYSWSIRGIKRHSKGPKCRAEQRIDYHQRHKEEELAYKYERRVNKREEARAFVFSY